ncbi:MAG: hypothetical protein OHK0026_01690 [Rhodocyclaceae bacterium]
MNWNSWSDFWSMGGYAFYVWGSYAVTALVFVLETAALVKRRRDTVERLLRLKRSGLDDLEPSNESET